MIYTTIVRLVLLYGAEPWVRTKKDKDLLNLGKEKQHREGFIHQPILKKNGEYV